MNFLGLARSPAQPELCPGVLFIETPPSPPWPIQINGAPLVRYAVTHGRRKESVVCVRAAEEGVSGVRAM
jgi:hypothetical protein